MTRRAWCLALALACPTAPAAAGEPGEAALAGPSALDGVTVEERPGALLPLAERFADDAGSTVRLGHLFDGRRPVLLVLGYYRCPMLCSLVLTGTAGALDRAGRTPGERFRAVVVSIDPREGPGDAAPRRREVAAVSGPVAAERWTFLTGSEEAVGRLAGAVGFRYRFEPGTDQYAHPAVAVAVAPDGRVSGYVHGIRPEPAALDAALSAAAEFEAGKSLGDVVAACFQYTPALRRWSGAIAAGLRVGGVVILLGVGGLFGWIHLWGARRHAGRNEEPGA